MSTTEKTITDRRDHVKWLALAGIIGSALFAVSGVWEMVSPATSASGNQILDPAHFQIGSIMVALGYVGLLATALAFYLDGATGSGWLGKIAIGIMTVGVLAAFGDQINRIITAQETQNAPWQIILFMSAVFIAPVLLGVAALRGKVIPLWMALYPIVMVAVVPLALWMFGSIIGIGSDLVIFLQGLLWLGFALIVYTSGSVTTVAVPA